jgi:peroxiredoxin (alkyl hydroperoxide reductase subunit C)
MSVLVSRPAPDFIAAAVLGNGEIVDSFILSEAIKGKKAVLSELIAFDKRYEEFVKRGVEVIAVSIDSQFTHNAWRNTPVNEGGIGPVKYTMVADVKHDICQAYDVEHPEKGIALRGSFLIDESGLVRHQVVNDLPFGRNIDDMLRMVDALNFHEEHGEVCPAGWQQGSKGMVDSPEGVASYLAENASSL